MNDDITNQKLFAFMLRSNGRDGLVALSKLGNIPLEQVAVNLGGGRWVTRYGNIEFRLGYDASIPRPASYSQCLEMPFDYQADVRRRSAEWQQEYSKIRAKRGY